MTAPVTVAELKAAWRALEAGAFRGQPLPTEHPAPTATPAASGGSIVETHAPVLLVAGAAGNQGTSTVALALAEASDAGRLVDCAPVTTSGLVEACDHELGLAESGWRHGRRGHLLLERNPERFPPAHPPLPPRPTASGLTVIDAGTDALTLTQATGWLADTLRDPRVPLVLVAACSVPALRRLDVALDLLGDGDRDVQVAVTGVAPRHWPREVALPTRLRALGEGGLTCIPHDRSLARLGLTAAPLPTAVVAAAHELLRKGNRP